MYDLIDNQVRSLRKRQVINSYTAKQRKGTYWGIWSDMAKYNPPQALPCPYDKTAILASTATRLKALDDALQYKLMNWGYAICDAAMRKHYTRIGQRPPVSHLPAGSANHKSSRGQDRRNLG